MSKDTEDVCLQLNDYAHLKDTCNHPCSPKCVEQLNCKILAELGTSAPENI